MNTYITLIPIKAAILVAFVLLLLQALSQVVKAVDAIRGEPEPEAPDAAAAADRSPGATA